MMIDGGGLFLKTSLKLCNYVRPNNYKVGINNSLSFKTLLLGTGKLLNAGNRYTIGVYIQQVTHYYFFK